MLRKSLFAFVCASCIAGHIPSAAAQDIEIQRNGAQASLKGPANWFTGTAWIDGMFKRDEPSRLTAATVSFEPGARTAWHVHPLGQTLIVTAGKGLIQMDGRPIQEIKAGDIINISAYVRHWHGATPITTMTHIAIQEALDGKNVEWMEHVSDADYNNGQ